MRRSTFVAECESNANPTPDPDNGRPSDMVMSSHVDPDEHTNPFYPPGPPGVRGYTCVRNMLYTVTYTDKCLCRAEELRGAATVSAVIRVHVTLTQG